VSKSQPVSEGDQPSPSAPNARAADPRKNPSYPQRVHIAERAHWQSVLAGCEGRVAAARGKLDALAAIDPARPGLERLYAQMLGARDQVADCARRLPGETGDLYEEDRHRVDEALAALDRAEARWGGRG
jgi:hypothetical protein